MHNSPLDNNYKYLITDIDGTIADRMPIYIRIFVKILTRFGIDKQFLHDYYINSSGSYLRNQIAGALAAKGITISSEEIKELAREFFTLADKVPVPLFEGAEETLNEIHKKGIPIFATSGSNTPELKKVLLKVYNLPYSLVTGSDNIPKGIDHIVGFADTLGLTLTEFCYDALLVGDGPRDMEIAKECDIYAVGIPNTVPESKLIEAGADEIVTSIREIIKFF